MNLKFYYTFVLFLIYNSGFSQCPTVDVGEDKTECAEQLPIPVFGIVGDAVSVTWTSNGSGVFENGDLHNARYIPSSNDFTNGSVTLTLTATGTNPCTPVSDQMVITFEPLPVINLGTDYALANNVTEINLDGSGNGTNVEYQWLTSGTGIFIPDNTRRILKYIPSAADKAAGSVTITCTGKKNTCYEIDYVIITFVSVTSLISSEPDGKSLKAYPNPANDYLNLELNNSGEYSLSIYNGNGVLVTEEQSFAQTNQVSVSTGHLSAGIYLIKVSEGNQVYRVRFYKQ